MEKQTLSRSRFCIDAIPNVFFEGYTDGETWNGWACPYFTRDVAEEILTASEKNGYRWHYESDSDTFQVSHVDDPGDYPPESFGAAATVASSGISLYGIGTFSWSWTECQEP